MKQNIIILGGNSKNNIKWINDINNLFSSDYQTYNIYYDNWYNNKSINLDDELNKVIEIEKSLDNYNIICKSIGILITLNGILNNKLNPSHIFLLGIPLRFCKENNIDIINMIESVLDKTKVTIIQQKYDPLGFSSEIKKLIDNKINLFEIEGNNHHYEEFIEIKKIIDKEI